MACQKKSFLIFLLLWSSVRSVPVHLYVSPTGSDSNDGRQPSHPIKTLQHAVNLLQQSDIKGNDVFVELMQGYHDLTSTLTFNRDLGGVVVIRAYQGQEIHVTGGRRIASSQFRHVTDTRILQRLPQGARPKVLELDLSGAGLTDLGVLRPYGFYVLWSAPMEIFINGRPLRLAEWPNNNFVNIKSVPDGESGTRFTYDSAGRDSNWASETEPWAYGWWYWSWADSALPVSHVDPATHTITLASKSEFGLRVGHYDPDRAARQAGFADQGGYFRVINMLCELDEPGEYYIDRINKKLYLWPNTPQQTLTSSDVVYTSVLNQCISIDSSVYNLHFEDFTVEACRQFGFDMHSARGVTFKNMELRNTGSAGINCNGNCRNVSVLASEFHDVGGGVRISGGDRTALTPSDNVIQDNHMWDFSRVGAIPCDAVTVDGVGTTVSHNHLHHGQYTAVRWTGNQHTIEYNDIHDVCFNASDCGAIHSGREWTWRGNVIRYNHIHNVLRYVPGADNRGIMLDDEYSSVLIEHNVFYNNDVHVNIGGGRDNVIRDNVMYKAASYSVQLDGRGLESWGHSVYLRQKLAESPYKSPLWTSRYPELASILDHHPEAPEGNQVYNNVFYNTIGIGRVYYSGNNINRPDYFDVHDNFRVLSAGDFSNPDHGDMTLQCQALDWVRSHHFQQPVLPQDVGPRVPTGPHYLHIRRQPPISPTVQPHCSSSTVAPATSIPRTAFMPDGSAPNTLYPNIPKQGCWFVIDHCPSHPEAEGTRQDDLGTAAGTEKGCLARAAAQRRWCGSPSNGKVIVVYGPTGAMTFAAEGCYFAEYSYGCDQTDGNAGLHRDTWAEQNRNASHDEQVCLQRSADQWPYCGKHVNYPITSVYGPTGNFRTAGAGCWIKIPSCPAHVNLQGFFYDAWGATNLGTDQDQEECLDRADYYWQTCGSNPSAPVTAFFRPRAVNHTVPS